MKKEHKHLLRFVTTNEGMSGSSYARQLIWFLRHLKIISIFQTDDALNLLIERRREASHLQARLTKKRNGREQSILHNSAPKSVSPTKVRK